MQKRIGRTGQAELDRQNLLGRNWTGRTGKDRTDRKNKTGITRLAGQDFQMSCQDRTSST
jgi:hypothetical protein